MAILTQENLLDTLNKMGPAVLGRGYGQGVNSLLIWYVFFEHSMQETGQGFLPFNKREYEISAHQMTCNEFDTFMNEFLGEHGEEQNKTLLLTTLNALYQGELGTGPAKEALDKHREDLNERMDAKHEHFSRPMRP